MLNLNILCSADTDDASESATSERIQILTDILSVLYARANVDRENVRLIERHHLLDLLSEGIEYSDEMLAELEVTKDSETDNGDCDETESASEDEEKDNKK